MNQMTLKRNNMEELSNCCGASRWYDESDICSDCKEHADFEEIEN